MIVCHALIIVCVHTHAHQDFSVAIWIRRRKFMNAQEHISSSWFCTLKMHDLTKICQSHKSHLPCRWASFSTNFIFNIKVDKRPKEVESARKFELFFSHHHLFFFFFVIIVFVLISILSKVGTSNAVNLVKKMLLIEVNY